MNKYKDRGYLNEDFKLFYIVDNKAMDFELHYHRFHKVLIFLGGNVTYYIEGRNYILSPYDVVLVGAGDIHRPIVNDSSRYERIIMYLSPELFAGVDLIPLFKCFQHSRENNSNLIHIDGRIEQIEQFKEIIEQLADSSGDCTDFRGIHQKAHIIDFLIHLNNYILNEKNVFELEYVSNPKIVSAIEYINLHLTESLTVDSIADSLYISPSYLMHLFKTETGYTLMNYIEKKRLFAANSLIARGMSKTEACYQSGFKNYAAYYYANKKNKC